MHAFGCECEFNVVVSWIACQMPFKVLLTKATWNIYRGYWESVSSIMYATKWKRRQQLSTMLCCKMWCDAMRRNWIFHAEEEQQKETKQQHTHNWRLTICQPKRYRNVQIDIFHIRIAKRQWNTLLLASSALILILLLSDRDKAIVHQTQIF